MAHLGTRAWLLVIGGIAVVGAFVVGIDDNLPGIAILYGGLICLTLAAVYRWRRPQSFLKLFALSGLGFFVFAVLHNLLYAVGKSTSIGWIQAVMEGLHVAAFMIAILLCPVGVLVGLIGWITTHLLNRRLNKLSAG